MPPVDAPQDPTADPVRAPSATSGRLMRQASVSSALAAVVVVGVALVASTVGQPAASDPPAGAVGVTQGPLPTEPLGSWVAVTATPAPFASAEPSAAASSSSQPSALPTAWRTSPPSTCNPYVKPCDPTVPPVYDYVRIMISSNGSTDATIGFGKVTIQVAGKTYSCWTYSRFADCHWDIPPGMTVVATAYRQTGSVCTSFQLMWEDHTSIEHDDCSPITFTTRTQMAQLWANFDLASTLPSPQPTDPPPPTDPPATPEPTLDPTPEPTPEPTPTPEATPATG